MTNLNLERTTEKQRIALDFLGMVRADLEENAAARETLLRQRQHYIELAHEYGVSSAAIAAAGFGVELGDVA